VTRDRPLQLHLLRTYSNLPQGHSEAQTGVGTIKRLITASFPLNPQQPS
jgi:hypothetical protein